MFESTANSPYKCAICGGWVFGSMHTCSGDPGLSNLPRREEHYLGVTPDQVRQIVREELQRARKVGCKNFQMRDGLGFCKNCGYHHDEH